MAQKTELFYCADFDDALNWLLADSVIGFTPSQILSNLPLHDGKGWQDWPEDYSNDITSFMNAVVRYYGKVLDGVEHSLAMNAMDIDSGATSTVGDGPSKADSAPPLKHIWSSSLFHIPGYKVEASQIISSTPQIVLLEPTSDENSTVPSWSDVLVIQAYYPFSQESDTIPPLHTHKCVQNLICLAKAIFDAQPSRRFVVTSCIMKPSFMAFYIFDRTHVLCSKTIDIHKDPETFLRFIVGFARAEIHALGLDPTLFWKGDKQFLVAGKRHYEVLDVAYHDGVVHGPGVVCYDVRNDDGTKLVIKDYWAEVGPQRLEASLLTKIEKLQASESGLCGIPRIVSDEELYFDRAVIGGGVRKIVQKRDCSADLCEPLWSKSDERGEKRKKNPEESVEEDEDKGNDEDDERTTYFRKHRRMVHTGYGDSLETFRSLEELLLAMIDIVHAIKSLHDHGYVHRNIDPNNIRLQGTQGIRRGVLINYEHATEASTAKPIPPVDAAFMNTDVLHNIDRYLESVPAFKWEYYHDLESLLYVLVGICVTRAGPFHANSSCSDASIIGTWCMGGHRNGFTAWVNKYAAVSMHNGQKSDLTPAFHPYFAPLNNGMQSIQELLFKYWLHKKCAFKQLEKAEFAKLKDSGDKGASLVICIQMLERAGKGFEVGGFPAEAVFESYILALRDMIDEVSAIRSRGGRSGIGGKE